MIMTSETLRNMLVKQEPRSVSCCYVCSGSRADYPIFSKPCGDRPFFPFLEHHQPPEGADFITFDGKVLVCSLCYAFLTQQWNTYERTKTPHSKRIYWLKRLDNGPFAGMEVNLQQDYESLFDASEYESRPKSKNVRSVSLDTKKNNKFKWSERSESRESTSSSYQCEKVEVQESCVNNALDLSMPSRTPSQSSSTLPSPQEVVSVCYVCGIKYKNLLNVFAKPIANCPYFPSLLSHPKPIDAKPIDDNGRVKACENCHRCLIHQWDFYQKRNVPHTERVYQLKPDNSFNSHISSKHDVASVKKTFICFTCGMTAQLSVQRTLQCYPEKENDSYFSFLSHMSPAPGAEPLKDGRANVCSLCYKSLFRQLKVFEMSSVPEECRKYKIHNDSTMEQSSVLRQHLKGNNVQRNLNCENICYLCEHTSDILYPVSTVVCNDMYFPFIRDLKKSSYDGFINEHGNVRVCKECHVSLKYQWDAFEHAKIPIMQRQYRIVDAKSEGSRGNLKFDEFRPQNSQHLEVSSSSSNGLNYTMKNCIPCDICCLCKRYLSSDDVFVLDSLPRQGNMHFPFLGTYVKVDDNKQVDRFGKVLVCGACHSLLKSQWELFESAHIPHSQRQYRIFPPVAEKEPKREIVDDCNLNTASSALHVQVSSPDVKVNLSTKGHGNPEPLLTTVNTFPVTNVITSNALSSNSNVIPKTCDSKSPFEKLSSASDESRLRICGPLDVPFGHPLLFNSVCFVCGESSSAGPMYSMNSVPSQTEGVPFFPFLAKRVPPDGAEKLTEEGNCLVCMFCYHSLVSQYLAYESSSFPEDGNPWHRRYNTHNYVCYICGTVTYRQRVCSISVRDFPFLFEHPRPPGALTLLGGECVITCLTCFESITSQWKDFERMKVPLEMRKYNWIVLPAPVEDEKSRGCQILNNQENVPSNPATEEEIDSRISSSSIHESGLSHGPKPPPHLPVQPIYSSKPISRAIATTSPIHPNSSLNSATYASLENNASAALNATRTSSFAAALRKLAKQAVDPIAERESVPISTSAISQQQQSHVPKQAIAPSSYLNSGHLPLPSSCHPHVPVPSFSTSRSHEKRKSVDLGRYTSANSHATAEAINFKMDHSKGMNVHEENRNDSLVDRKHSPLMLTPQPQFRSRDEHNLSSRGFQPYRNSEDSVSSSSSSQVYDGGSSSNVNSYPYHPSAYASPNLSHPYRLDESLYMERYGLIRPPAVSYPSSANVLPYPGMPFYSNSRYPPPDMLNQHSSASSSSSACKPLHHDERIKSEEEFRENESLHLRERHTESENDMERYRYREKEYIERGQELLNNEKDHRMYSSSVLSRNSQMHSPLPESTHLDHGRYDSGHDVYIHKKSPSASSGPLNLVKQASPVSSYSEAASSWHRTPQQGSNYQNYSSQSFKNTSDSSYDSKFRPPPLISELNPDAQNSKHLRMSDPSSSGMSITKNTSPMLIRDYHREDVKEFFSNSNSHSLSDRQINGSHMSESYDYISYDNSSSFKSYRFPQQSYRPPDEVLKQKCDIKNGSLSTENHWSSFARNEKFPIPPQYRTPSREEIFQSNRSAVSPSTAPYKLNESPSQQLSYASKESSITRALLQNPITPSVIERYVHASVEPCGNVVSKLDLREAKVRKLRSDHIVPGDEISDSESDEEGEALRMKEFLMITKGPPLKFEDNPVKVDFLKLVNLISIPEKEAVQLKKVMKRKRLLREGNFTPNIEEKKNELQYNDQHIAELSRRLWVEDNSESKREFLKLLGLKPVSDEYSEQVVPVNHNTDKPGANVEYVDNFCYPDTPTPHYKKRRTLLSGLQRSNVNKYGMPMLETCQINGIIPSGHCDVKPNTLTLQTSDSNCSDSLPFTKPFVKTGPSPLPPLIPAEQLNVIKTELVPNSGKAIVLTQDPRVKLLDKSFAQEFHESVLQATQMQLGQKIVTTSSNSQPKSPSKTSFSTNDKDRKIHEENKCIFKWPGIEAIMESYETHISDQNMERDFLVEMCNKLRAKNQELTAQKVCLGQKTAELVQLKNLLDAERQNLEGSASRLKMLIQNFR